MDHSEAILFRILVNFFGQDHVIPRMSVLSVCGGSLPDDIQDQMSEKGYLGPKNKQAPADLRLWAKKSKCQFTIVNGNDDPKIVIEFFSGFSSHIDISEEEHQRLLAPILRAAGIGYITISNAEFQDILDPDTTLDFCMFLKAKVEHIGIEV